MQNDQIARQIDKENCHEKRERKNRKKTTENIVKSTRNLVKSARSIFFLYYVKLRASLLEGMYRDIIWGFIHSYFIIIFCWNLSTEHLRSDLHQFLVMYTYNVHKKWQEKFSNRQKYCHFKIPLLFLSKLNDNFGCRFDNSKMRELSKKSTIYGELFH